MDKDVLYQLLCAPPMLYLVLVMISWSIGVVPRLVSQGRHRLVWLAALLHLVTYSGLVHRAVPMEPWMTIVFASLEVNLLLTLGGYLLHWVMSQVATGLQIPCRRFLFRKPQIGRSPYAHSCFWARKRSSG